MKSCTKCSQILDLSRFSKDRQKSDGYSSHCKQCHLDASRKRRGVLPERYFANKKTYADNAEKHRVWRSKNREQHLANIQNRDKEKVLAAQREWRSRNKESQQKRTLLWAKENPSACALHSANRRASKKMAIPSWANSFFISEAYSIAKLRTEMLGIKYVVDHIVPLQSKMVCGLHVEHNLQVIPETINAAKSNVWWPNMPGVK